MADLQVDYQYFSTAVYANGALLQVNTGDSGFLWQIVDAPIEAQLGIFSFGESAFFGDHADYISGTFAGALTIGGGTATASQGALPAVDLGSPADGTVILVLSWDPNQVFPDTLNGFSSTNYAACFGPGTMIATPDGPRAVQTLRPGDRVTTAKGEAERVLWLGHRTYARAFSGLQQQPVRIAAGSLGPNLPTRDLAVTGDHGLVLDGMVVNASALVNGDSIDWVPLTELPEQSTYYHIETEHHAVILAEGLSAETYCDAAGRRAFDNYDEYLALCGTDRLMPEMTLPRVTSSRMLPPEIRDRIGLADEQMDFVA